MFSGARSLGQHPLHAEGAPRKCPSLGRPLRAEERRAQLVREPGAVGTSHAERLVVLTHASTPTRTRLSSLTAVAVACSLARRAPSSAPGAAIASQSQPAHVCGEHRDRSRETVGASAVWRMGVKHWRVVAASYSHAGRQVKMRAPRATSSDDSKRQLQSMPGRRSVRSRRLNCRLQRGMCRPWSRPACAGYRTGTGRRGGVEDGGHLAVTFLRCTRPQQPQQPYLAATPRQAGHESDTPLEPTPPRQTER